MTDTRSWVDAYLSEDKTHYWIPSYKVNRLLAINEELKNTVKEHLDHIHEVKMGRAKDSEGNVIKHDEFFKGYNAAYVNISNAISMSQKQIQNCDMNKDLEDAFKEHEKDLHSWFCATPRDHFKAGFIKGRQ